MSKEILKITPTVYSALSQSSQHVGIDQNILQYSTLNEKFGVFDTEVLEEDEQRHLNYFTIGRGGMRAITADNGEVINVPSPHSPEHAALYEHLPLILRETDDDLSEVERSKYCMRVKETHNGVEYFAYYMKRINMFGVKAEAQHVTVVDGVPTYSPFVPNSSNLNPTPPNIPNTGVVPTSGSYLTTSTIITVELTQTEIEEILTAIDIIYGEAFFGVISEIGLVAGVDRDVTVEDGLGLPITFKEVITAQVDTFLTTNIPLMFNKAGFLQNVDLGSSNPMLI